MGSAKKYLGVLLILVWVLAALGCVTEKKQTHLFKEPTKEDLARAIAQYIQITYLYVERKDFEHAMINVKHALDIDSHSAAAVTAMAVVYQYQGDTDKARATFQKAIGLDSTFSLGHLNYGQFLFAQKEYAEACHQFQIASNDDFFNKRSEAFFDLGICYREAGDLEKAEAAFTRCTGIDPNSAVAFGALAAIRFQQQRYPESKQMFDKFDQLLHAAGQPPSAEMVWLGIRLARIFKNQDEEASLTLFLKNTYPFSKEYLEYQESIKQ